MCVCIILSFWEQSVCVCVCVHILIHLHSHTDIYAPPNTHTHTHTHPHTHTNTSASRREYLVNMALLLCDGHGGRNERGEYCEHMFAVLQVYPDTITPLLCPAGNLYSQVLYTYLEAQTGTLSSIYVHTKNAADTAAAKKVLGDKMAEHPVPDMKEPSGQQQQQQPTTSKGGESKKRGRGPSGEKQRKQRTKNSKGWRNVSAEVKKYEKENKEA